MIFPRIVDTHHMETTQRLRRAVDHVLDVLFDRHIASKHGGTTTTRVDQLGNLLQGLPLRRKVRESDGETIRIQAQGYSFTDALGGAGDESDALGRECR